MKKDLCIIQGVRKPTGNYVIRVAPGTYNRVYELSTQAGRTIGSITDELLKFALDRAVLDIQTEEE